MGITIFNGTIRIKYKRESWRLEKKERNNRKEGFVGSSKPRFSSTPPSSSSSIIFYFTLLSRVLTGFEKNFIGFSMQMQNRSPKTFRANSFPPQAPDSSAYNNP
jgi:hypothetical protein